MQKSIQTLTLIASLAAVLLAAWTAFGSSNGKDIRFVRSSDLVYGYEGMKEAQAALAEKTVLWQANLDTLKEDYKRALGELQAGEGETPAEGRELRQQDLQGKAINYQKYAAAVQERALDEEEELLAGILSQINSFVEEYAQEKGFDLIVGTTTDGSVLYGAPELDVTDELLQALNKNYRGE